MLILRFINRKMGNADSSYESLEEDRLPPVQYFGHKKGKAYGIMLNEKLKTVSEWSYFPIYDLRNGKATWRLYIKVYGDELILQFYLMRKKNDKDDPYFFFPLKYSSLSNNYMTIFKGYKDGKTIYLELYGDNIHSQRLENLKLVHKFVVFGFLKFDGQDKIPITF